MSEWKTDGHTWTKKLGTVWCQIFCCVERAGTYYDWWVDDEYTNEEEFTDLAACQQSCEEAAVAWLLIELAHRAAQWQQELDAGMARTLRTTHSAMRAVEKRGRAWFYGGDDSEECRQWCRELDETSEAYRRAMRAIERGYPVHE